MKRLSPTLLLALLACEGAPPADSASPDADADGDGLRDAYEARIGTDPDAADSDGDGCEDAVEVLTWFDPADPADRPYQGAYPRGPRPDEDAFAELARAFGEGFEPGQLNPSWTLTDQHGQEVELRDFYGQVILVEIVTEWCSICASNAPELDAFYRQNKDRGFVVLQILVEGVQNDAEPVPARWAERLGLEHPVLEDHSPGDRSLTEVARHYITSPTAAYEVPNSSLIDREHRLVSVYDIGTPSVSRVEALLDAPAPEVAVDLPEDADALRAALGLDADTWIADPSLCGG